MIFAERSPMPTDGRTAEWQNRCATAVVLVVLLCVAGCSRSGWTSVPPEESVRRARIALAKEDFAEAQRLTESIPREAPEWQAGKLIAGEAATKSGRLRESLAHYLAAAEDDTTTDGQLALFSAAEVHKELGQLGAAEQLYRRVLAKNPTNGITNSRMALLLCLTNRRWEALDYFFELIKGGDATFRELGMAADVSRQILQPDLLTQSISSNPTGPQVCLAAAADAFHEGRPEALSQLRSLVQDHPDLIASHAMLGELLVDNPSGREFLEWHAALPTAAEQSPDIWYVRGLWARRQADLSTAADCLWQSVIRMPFHRRGFCSLAQVLTAINDPDGDAVQRYCDLLGDVSQQIDHVLVSDGRNEAAVRKVTELMEQAGRIWEACAWAVEARRQFQTSDWPDSVLNRLAHRLQPELPRIDSEYNPAAGRVASNVPGFDTLIADAASKGADDVKATSSVSTIRFDSADVINFQYNNADDPETQGVRVQEQTGGGVGIIDFDRDDFPDVFLPQGVEWISGRNAPEHTSSLHDGLFRNLRGEDFADVSDALSSGAAGFGQGCTVGDFNNDGFPDLYVANIGRNCLYQNLGDGTFRDVTDDALMTNADWTASAVLCDLNADGLPDIYDVNYLTGDDVYTKICRERACSPKVFDGALDCLWINQADGRFQRVEGATPGHQSKGLGIVVFETVADRRPSLFIANDQVANFLLKNDPANNSENILLKDDALITGLAFNDQGLAMACMGIAVDDLDGNGLLDLFVTNFQDESNTVYLQDTVGLFVDATRAAGIQAASLPYTGWGTQTLDADLDGLQDLIVANGHVDDGREFGRDYHQPPQLFQNRGGRFQELPSSQLGSYFSGMYLGRGVARVDWNRDGLPEFIVSNINSSVSVLKNASESVGHSVSVRLVATETARDAIGARVTVTFAGREVTRQLTAGDGYMASNERLVQFGLGSTTKIDRVQIHWPSSAISELKSVPVDCTLTVVEGIPTATFRTAQRLSSTEVAVNP